MAMAPATTPRSVVHIVIRAESEDDQQYDWHDKLAMCDPVQKLAESWARAHGVPGTAVGFDDDKGQEVALDATPVSMGWMPGQEVELKAFPTEDRFMEQAPTGEEMEAVQSAPGTGEEDGRQAASDRASAVAGSLPAEPTSARSACAAGAKDTSGKSAAAAMSSLANAKSPVTRASSGSRGNPPSAGTERAGSASSARAPAMEAKSTARGRASSSRTAAGHGSAEPDASEQGRGRGRQSSSVASDEPPQDTEPITFATVNPKRSGSSAFERYEKYKRARTVSEALNLGAVKGDIMHDFKRGFLKRR